MLLDTHVWVWSQESPEQLGPAARRSLTEPAALVHVSSISSLEIARLVRGERLRLAGRLQTWVSESLAALRADTVPLTHEVAVDGYELPSTYSHAWTSRGGEYILSDNPDFNPNVEMSGTWVEMTPTR
jgi:PIN domain nuclease of toxin-antitoxin system